MPMQIVVPMAGAGRRFAEAGYTLPKPLLPVLGVPMVVRAVQDLPAAERVVFICHPEHVRVHRIDAVLKKYFPSALCVVAPELTQGQACSVRLAADLLDRQQPVLVAACDNTHVYNHQRLQRLIADPNVHALIWTYRGDPRVLMNPQWYGWVRTSANREVQEVSVKVPISPQPLDDPVVSGCFWFRSAAVMLEGIDTLLARDERVSGEFYMDSVPNILIREGYRVVAFETDKYIGWGTPDALEDYRHWERYFVQQRRAS